VKQYSHSACIRWPRVKFLPPLSVGSCSGSTGFPLNSAFLTSPYLFSRTAERRGHSFPSRVRETVTFSVLSLGCPRIFSGHKAHCLDRVLHAEQISACRWNIFTCDIPSMLSIHPRFNHLLMALERSQVESSRKTSNLTDLDNQSCGSVSSLLGKSSCPSWSLKKPGGIDT